MNTFNLFILFILVLQTTVTVLLLRYSRKISENDDLYDGSVAVLLVEILKYTLCYTLFVLQNKCKIIDSCQKYINEVILNPKETLKLIIPAGLYTVQNNLLYVALTNLDVATFQVTYQFKILTTSLFSVLILGNRLKLIQWISLVILTVGVILVQIPQSSESNENTKNSSDDVTIVELRDHNRLLGLGSVLSACVSSAFAGVYYEKLVKSGSQPSIIIRNLQLGLFSLIFALITVLYNQKKEFLHGFNIVVWIVVVFQAVGGLVVAAVIKYTDNIQKSFASSISIIVSAVSSFLILNDEIPGLYFIFGTLLVFLSTYLYNAANYGVSTVNAKPMRKFVVNSV